MSTILIQCKVCGFYQSNGYNVYVGMPICQHCEKYESLEWHRYRPGFSSRQVIMAARFASHKVWATGLRRKNQYWYDFQKNISYPYRPKLIRLPFILYHTVLAWWYQKIREELYKSGKAQSFLIKTKNL